MHLKAQKRNQSSKSELNRIRTEKNIPAVLYQRGSDGLAITISGSEFGSVLRSIEPGQLSTSRFTLQVDGGKEMNAIVKEIQYHPTTYAVWHLDFEELNEQFDVTLKVPVICTGVADCVGIKLGGVLRQVIRSTPVRCKPSKIPKSFEVDVRELEMNQTKRLSDIQIPAGVRALADLNEVAVVIAKR